MGLYTRFLTAGNTQGKGLPLTMAVADTCSHVSLGKAGQSKAFSGDGTATWFAA